MPKVSKMTYSESESDFNFTTLIQHQILTLLLNFALNLNLILVKVEDLNKKAEEIQDLEEK